MKNLKTFVLLIASMAMCAGQIQAQDNCSYYADADSACAYEESECSSYWSAAIPLGALALAAVLIATSNNGGHHSSSRSSCSNHHSHSHSSSSCDCTF